MTHARNTDPNTSHEAAAAIEPKLGALCIRIRDTMALHKPMIHDDLAQLMGLNPEQVHKRLSDLRDAGVIRDTGRRERSLRTNRNQIVWEVV